MLVDQRPLIDVEAVLKSLTLEQKVSLLSGLDFWHTVPIPEHGIPSVKCTDGPSGVRGGRFFNSVPALCIPCGTGLGATWNPELLEEAGQLLSRECEAKGAHVWLGPTVNIIRSPLNGRGFESFSEDPWLSGVLAAAIIRGVQSRGTLAALKHYVANDHEVEKMSIDVCLSDRALREVYLRPFHVAMREASPRVVMSSYNKVQGTHVSESKKLLQAVLRQEWGFDGLVMSDWFGTYSCEAALNAGLDIEMPGPTKHRGPRAVAAVSTGQVYSHVIEDRARSFLNFINDTASARVSPRETTRDVPEDRVLNRKLATESIVLLKNETNSLPLKVEDCDEIAIIGPNAKLPASCGGGSASLTPYYTTSVFQGIKRSLSKGSQIHYEPGVFGHVLLPILTGDNVTNDAGECGVSIELFNEPSTVQGRRSFDYLTIPDTTYQLMDYSHPEKKDTFYMSMRANYIAEHTGPHEFGLAIYGVGRLYINDQLVVDNETEQSPGGMFFGKGSSEKRGLFHMCVGQSYKLRVEAGSAATSKVVGGSMLPLPGGACRLGGSLKIEPDEGIASAAALASRCKRTFVVVGLNPDVEKEGKDRTSMSLPPRVDDLVTAVLKANPQAIVITQAGNPVAMPWRDEAQTILHCWYGGNEAGNAVADVIFGEVSPSGKLPMTFPVRLEDGPSFLSSNSDNGKMHYLEDVFVGHRWFEKRDIGVAFPFGHGLSYTSFNVSSLGTSRSEVSVDISNTGAMEGSEVLQVWISRSELDARSRFARPLRTLAAFSKVSLPVGSQKRVTISIPRDAISVWDEKRGCWCCEGGVYAVSVVTAPGQETSCGEFEVTDDEFWMGL